jgi:SAM-dependent methyltransferase
MNIDLLRLLRCPISRQNLVYHSSSIDYDMTLKQDGFLLTVDGMYRYPVVDGIPRFSSAINYASNFGLQWNYFSRTQLDSYSGHSISSDRFWTSTNWEKDGLNGKWVLDVGCGSGRFSEIALEAGANVVALDYSTAVDASKENLKRFKKFHVVQGDIYSLPFEFGVFDYVFSLGVLQHTPDVKKAFYALPPMLKQGGGFCVDFYQKTLLSLMLPKYWLRPITKRIDKKLLFKIILMLTPYLLKFSRFIGCLPLIGKYLKRIVPVADYSGIYPLNEKQLNEWAVLDTYDWFSPAFDFPQTSYTVKSWMTDFELTKIEVVKAGHLVARGWKL